MESDDSQPPRKMPPPPMVALASWLVPGAGYWLIGQRGRGIVVGVTVICLFLGGLLVAGVRVLEVPGYDRNGVEVRYNANGQLLDPNTDKREWDAASWSMSGRGLLSEIISKPWSVMQVLNGPLSLAAAGLSVRAASTNVPTAHSHLAEIGTLYTAVAGMLNLLGMIDASSRAGQVTPQPRAAAPASVGAGAA